MKLAGRIHPLEEMQLEEAIHVVSDAGAEAVELSHLHPGMGPGVASPELARRVRALLTELDLPASATGWHCPWVLDDGNYERIRRLITLAREFGTDVFITSGVGLGGEGDVWGRLVERTGVLCSVAEDAGVRLAIEHEPRFIIGSTADLLRLMEEVGSPALAANLDLGHALLVDADPVESIGALGARVAHCHVEGMSRELGHRHLLPWEGDLNLSACLRKLREVGFAGGLAVDLYGVDYAAVLQDCIDHLRRLRSAVT